MSANGGECVDLIEYQDHHEYNFGCMSWPDGPAACSWRLLTVNNVLRSGRIPKLFWQFFGLESNTLHILPSVLRAPGMDRKWNVHAGGYMI